MHIKRISAKTGVRSRTAGGSDFDFTLNAAERIRVVPGTITELDVVVDDMLCDRYVSGAAYREADINIVSATNLNRFRPYFWSSDESIATVSQNGVVTYVSDGDVVIYVSTPWLTRGITVNVGLDADIDLQYKSWADGTLAKAIDDTVNGLIDGKTPSDTTKALWIDDTNQRNPNLWAASYAKQLTAISKSGPIVFAPGDIAISAIHTGGLASNWINEDGVQVSNVTTLAYRDLLHDIRVRLLNRKLTYEQDGIEPALAPPSTLINYLPSLSSQLTVPAISTDGSADGLLELNLSGVSALSSTISHRPLSVTQQNAWWEQPIGGDSGHGIGFLVPINGEMRFIGLGTWWYRYYGISGGGHGNIGHFLHEIDMVVGAMRGYDYTQGITRADLSEYPTFS